MYIGEYKIKGVKEEDGVATVSYKDRKKTPTVLNANLLELLRSPEPIKGGESYITDATVNLLATKFIAEMADLGLDIGMVAHVSQGMNTLAHNLREEAIAKAFDCAGGLDIKLTKLIVDLD